LESGFKLEKKELCTKGFLGKLPKEIEAYKYMQKNPKQERVGHTKRHTKNIKKSTRKPRGRFPG
jgi:endo-alpha-1,4-polygalactosaminidase (GH114 family)